MRNQKQELFCHGCSHYVIFDLNIDEDGNYEIPCPNCGHTHYRVVRNGRVTDERWQSSGAIIVTWATSQTSTASTSSTDWYFDSRGTSVATAY